MDEHDDDLEAQVQDAAERELYGFPDTGDELTEVEGEVPAEEDEALALDDDEAEL